MKKLSLVFLLLITVALTACGGGGTKSAPFQPPPPAPQNISITSDFLPVALQGHPYSATLTAINGQGALKWSIGPVSSTTLFPEGLSIDSATGVISGMPNFQGGAAFIATVTDANSTATKRLSIGGYGVLTAGAPSNSTAFQFQNYFQLTSFQGGVSPISYTISSGSLPPGLKVDSFGRIFGFILNAGTYSAVVTARDSWSTPQTADQVVNITVSASSMRVIFGVPNTQTVNHPTTARVFVVGGVPPYSFRVTSGILLNGITLDGATGKFLGTPTVTGVNTALVEVKDSNGTTAIADAGFEVVTGKGRNDTVQTATQGINNFPFAATLSPYIDPPDKAPLPADNDFYKLTSIAGTIVKITAWPEGGPIDPVIEVVDGNNVRFNTCNVPSGSGGSYSTACVGDDDASGTHAASVDYKVPGATATVVTSYIHVLDWRGDARPDMQYSLNISGNIEPFNVRLGATRGVAYSRSFPQIFGLIVGATTSTIDNGALPDGLNLSSAGVISGTPTTDGEYTFRIKIVDSAVPAQTFYIFATMGVGEAVNITSPAVWPTACLGKPYTFTVTANGGVTPLSWGMNNQMAWPNIILDQATGIVHGPATSTGTFTGTLILTDAAGSNASQPVSVTVQSCP